MKLLIFTQKVDMNDPVLGFFHSWLVEFASQVGTLHVVCLEKGVHALPEGVIVHSLGKENHASRTGYIKNLIRILYKIRNEYDTVFVHMNPIYIVLCGWLWKITGKKVYLWYTHRSVDLKLRIAVFFSTKVFTASAEGMKIHTNKKNILGHGIDVEKYDYTLRKYNSEKPLKIGYVGRVSRIKNIETLVASIPLLAKQGIICDVNIFGDCVTSEDTEYKNELLQKIQELSLENHVFFKGWVSHKALSTELNHLDATVNMSPTGGMDKSVLEAMILGLPTFVSNKAFETVFGEFSTQYVFEYGNPDSLAEHIVEYYNTSEYEIVQKTLARRVTQNFNIQNLVKKIIAHMYATSK